MILLIAAACLEEAWFIDEHSNHGNKPNFCFQKQTSTIVNEMCLGFLTGTWTKQENRGCYFVLCNRLRAIS